MGLKRVAREVALFVLAALFIAAPATAQQPQNLVVFLTDDQRFDTLWAMPIVQNRLVSRGVTFTKAVVTTPICCPFRASFLSGGFLAQNTGVLHNQEPLGGFTLFHDLDTLPVRLQRDGGYTTLLVGKYLNEYGPANMPDPSNPYIPPGWNTFLGWAGGSYFNGLLYSGSTGDQPGTGTPLPRWGSSYETDVYADHTINFLNATPGAQRFIYFATFVPHYPSLVSPVDANLFPGYVYRGRAYGEADLSDKPYYVQALASPFWTPIFSNLDDWDEYNRDNLRALQAVDRAVGRIFDWFDQAGELNDTVFVFTSDNGFLWGEHGMHGKQSPYEESIRVPLVVVVPGVAARVDDSLVAVDLDIPATFLDLAGLPVPGDGQSLVPLLQDPNTPLRDELLIEQYRAEWAALRTIDPNDGREWKYTWLGRGRGERELYDLTNDPLELDNLQADPGEQARIATMHARLVQLMGPHIDEGMTITPAPVFGVPYSLPLKHVGGTPPYSWEIVSGALPPGLTLDPVLGIIEGTPTTAGSVHLALVRLVSSRVATQSGQPQAHPLYITLTVQEGDVDGDGLGDASDSCPTLADLGDDGDGDGVDAACDTCPGVANPPVSAPAPWMTLTSRQRDDDGDGVGNACDFKYEGNAGSVISPADITDMRNSVARNVAGTNCGVTGAKICAQFDHSGAGSFVDPSDVTLLRARISTSNGPTCSSCAGPYSEPIESGSATLGRPIQCGSLATSACY